MKKKDEPFMGHLREEINELEDSEPTDKRSKLYKEWRMKINQKMKEYNKMKGWKCYKIIV